MRAQLASAGCLDTVQPAAVCEIDSTSGLRRGMSHIHLEIVDCLGLKQPAKLSVVLNTSNVSDFI